MQTTSKRIFSTFFLILFLSVTTYAQSESYDYKSDASASLDVVLDDISNQFGLSFSYPSEIIRAQTLDAVDITTSELSEFINLILRSTDLEYQIFDNQEILIRPRRTIPQNESRIKVSGTVLDTDGVPLSYASIVLDTLYIGNSSDDEGFYEFEVPAALADRKILFHLIGYDVIEKTIADNKQNPITKMTFSSLDIEEITLTDKVTSIDHKSASLNTTIQAKYLDNIISAPIISNDVLRSMQIVAGIDGTNDTDASIRIRGSQGDETLIVLDGIPIYKAEHFYGIFGAVNGNHINTVNLHKNNLPPEFGGKTGGLVEMKSKNYFQEASAILDLNMLTSAVTYSAPLSKTWCLIASGRTTYDNAADSQIFDWVEPSSQSLINAAIENRPLLLNTSPVIKFYDLNSKLIFRPNDRHIFHLSGFRSNDDYNNAYDITFTNRREIGTVNGREILDDQESWNNTGIALQHTGRLKKDWTIDSRIYNSSFNYLGSLKTSLELTRINNSVDLVDLTNYKENSISDWGFNTTVSKQKNDNVLSFGLSAIKHDVAFTFSADDTRKINLNSSAMEAAIYSNYFWTISDKWNVNIGGRMDYYSKTQLPYFAPRLSSQYLASDNFTVKGSFSKNYQFLREVTFYSRQREPVDVFLLTSEGKRNQTYPVGSSINAMLGMTYHEKDWTIDLELYNKDMDGIIDHTEVIVGTNPDDNKAPTRINKPIIGTGRSYGMDISIGYQKKNYTTWLAYTLSKTTNQFKEIFQNSDIPSEDDRRHQLKFNHQLKLGKWSISSSYVFASGLNQLNLFDQNEPLDLAEVIRDDSYTQLSPYHRIDLGVTRDFKVNGKKVSVQLGVFNLTNNKNVDYIQYLFSVPTIRNNQNRNVVTGTTTNLIDRTFNLTVRSEF